MTFDFAAVDRYVGARAAALRLEAGLTQSQVGQAIGVTFQQLQKYESGANRFSASRLACLAAFLNRKVSDFFPEDPEALGADTAPAPIWMSGFGLRLGRYCQNLSPHQRKLILELAQALAASEGHDDETD